jgi:rhamnose utilization protein RhaD (predicted bifunctional aldolase and dehydrogenase)
MTSMLDDLVRMANELGAPGNDYAILGEGNCSARIDRDSFHVTASGASLRTVRRDDFLAVSFHKAIELRDDESLSDEQIRTGLLAARMGARPDDRLPSTETSIHATCLQLPGVNFVGHTHPTAVNAITCSQRFEEAVAGRLFPDEIVLCGRAPVVVPYVDPGMPLAREINRRLHAYVAHWGETPRIMLLQNHGLFVFGATAKQVLDITAMTVKAARILAGTYALGGPRFMSHDDVDRIHTRADEHYRRRILGLR